MNRTKSVWKMHNRDQMTWFYLPWAILIFSFVINLCIAYFVTSDQTDYIHVTGGIASIFGYLMVVGYMLLPHSFSYVLNNSIRRKDYFWGTTAMITAVALFTSIVLTALGAVESRVTGGWGIGMRFFDLPYLSNGHALEQVWVYFSLIIHLFYVGFLHSSFYHRFRRKGMYIAIFILIGAGTIGSYLMTYYHGWVKLYEWFIQYPLSQHAVWIFATAVLYALLSYFMLRRSTI